MNNDTSAKPALYFYLSPGEEKYRAGGSIVTYQTVDVLTGSGYRAAVLHWQNRFSRWATLGKTPRCHWFENHTPVIGANEFLRQYNADRDIVVIGEDVRSVAYRFPGRVVIFCQNAYNDISVNKDTPKLKDPCISGKVSHVITVSDHNANFLRGCYPTARVHKVINSVDANYYAYVPPARKKRLLAISHKARMETECVLSILRLRSTDELPFDVCFIDNMSRAEVHDVLQDAACLLFLSSTEGLGLLCLEAMASGAVVVAYRSGAILDYMSDSNALLCTPHDWAEVAIQVEQLMANPRRFDDISRDARTAAEAFSPERQKQSILCCWEEILTELARHGGK